MSETPGVEIRELPPRGCLNLRGDADFRVAVPKIAGIDLPTEPCSWSEAGETIACWLGPDEWLLIVPDGAQSGVEQQLRESASDRFAIADVSGGFIHVNLRGVDAGKVLQKSSPYDFHPRNFPPGRCVQTVFAQAGALVAANADGSFDLVFRRSYADYVEACLRRAAG